VSDELQGRTALVTGASRGIGAAIATSLAAEGVRVALLARTRSALDEIARKVGNNSFAVECDISDLAAIERAETEITKNLGTAPEILVNNAGLFSIRAIDETTVEEFQSIIATNLAAPFTFLNAFLPAMKTRGSGHVITIGSIADRHIFAGNGAYSAAKFGARAIHEVLRAETRGTGIRATLISPAAVDTDIWDPIQYLGTTDRPDRSGMLSADSVAAAVMFALTRQHEVNIDELRLSRA
jgi:NADP-dependent 3-hydroxy acid dehydrogenase YdfG